ncbi:MAG: tetratricopeptide repeat protein, partial [Candidatus Thorarchaeota archaeon]
VCVEGRFNIKDLKDHLEMIEGNSGIRGMFAYFDGVSVLEFEKIHDGILQYHATAENLRKEGKFDEAAEIAKKAIFFGSKMGSEHGRKSTAKSWRILGDTYGFQTPPDYAQAEEAYKKGLELVSDDYESLSRLLYMYRIQKRYDDCKSLLDNMPEFTRGIVNVKIEDISIAVDIGEYDRAEQLSKELTERYSENTFSWVMLAHTYLKWERWEESIEASRKAISINEKEAVSYANLAEAFIGLGNMEDADAALEKGFEIEKEYGTLWYLKSQILTATGREAEAKDAMEKAEKFGYED